MPPKNAKPASATRIALSLLGASRGRALSASALIGGGELLGASSNATRIALSRLASSGDAVVESRGRYSLSAERRVAYAHVRTYRTGFAARVPWKGGFVAVLTADLPRRNPTAVRRRERALDLVGMRSYRHGVHIRPDNLEGGRAVVAAHLTSLGLDDEADVVGLALDATQVRAIEALYDVKKDVARASSLEAKVRAMLDGIDIRPKRDLAIESFWLGDEVLRFLARDPLLPESIADPAPRLALGDAMAELDEKAHALWMNLLTEYEATEGTTR